MINTANLKAYPSERISGVPEANKLSISVNCRVEADLLTGMNRQVVTVVIQQISTTIEEGLQKPFNSR